jgi:hypothetical protein
MTDPAPELFAIVPIPPPGTARDDLLRHAIITGTLDEVMEYIPQSLSRQEAQSIREGIGHALGYVQHVQDYERNLRGLADEGNNLVQRCESFVSRFEEREHQRRDAEAQEAARLAEERERKRLDQIAAGLAPIVGPEGRPIASPDDGELTIKHAPSEDPKRREPSEDDELAPMPFGTEPEEHRIPGPEPGSRLYPPHPQVAQPVSVSLNKA